MNRVAAAFSSFPSKDRGLLTADSHTPLSLLGQRVTVDLQTAAARVTVELEYVNESGKDVPVVVAYPVPSGWIVQGGSVCYDSKQAATSFIQNAVHTSVSDSSSGAAAAVGDTTVWTVATLPVPWTILVGSAVHITAHYIIPWDAVSIRSGQQQFVLPAELLLSPKRTREAAQLYNDKFKLPVKRHLKDGLEVVVHARLNVPLRGAVQLVVGDANATLPAQINYEGDAAFQMQYAAPFAQHPPHQPLKVVCNVLDTEEPLRLFLEADSSHALPEQGHALCVCLTPALGRSAVNAELVFLVDVHEVAVAKAAALALENALHGVPATTLVNVVVLRDDGNLCVYPGGSKPIDQVDLAAVCALVSGLTPQRPSTGLSRTRSALQAILAQTDSCGPIAAGYVRNVVLLADESEDRQKAAALITLGAEYRHTCRVHAVGLEYVPAVDAATLEVLAHEGGGVYAAATSSAEVGAAVVRVLLAATVPTLTNVKIQFPDAQIRAAFETLQLPVLPEGSQHHIFALAPENVTGTVSAYATGRVGEQVMEFVGSYDTANLTAVDQYTQKAGSTEGQGLLHAAAGVQRIRALVGNDSHAPTAADVREIVALSTFLSIPSPYTQLVLVRPGGEPLPAASRYVLPAQLFSYDVEQRRMERLARQQNAHPLGHRSPPPQAATRIPQSSASTSAYLRTLVEGIVADVLTAPCVGRLLPLQARDGSFSLSARFSLRAGIPEKALVQAKPADCGSAEVWATVVAVQRMAQARLPVTALCEGAARKFIEQHNGAQWLEAAQALLAAHAPQPAA